MLQGFLFVSVVLLSFVKLFLSEGFNLSMENTNVESRVFKGSHFNLYRFLVFAGIVFCLNIIIIFQSGPLIMALSFGIMCLVAAVTSIVIHPTRIEVFKDRFDITVGKKFVSYKFDELKRLYILDSESKNSKTMYITIVFESEGKKYFLDLKGFSRKQYIKFARYVDYMRAGGDPTEFESEEKFTFKSDKSKNVEDQKGTKKIIKLGLIASLIIIVAAPILLHFADFERDVLVVIYCVSIAPLLVLSIILTILLIKFYVNASAVKNPVSKIVVKEDSLAINDKEYKESDLVSVFMSPWIIRDYSATNKELFRKVIVEFSDNPGKKVIFFAGDFQNITTRNDSSFTEREISYRRAYCCIRNWCKKHDVKFL